jgi:1-acyl-sn-glycerol-3-phosphate acyltransferase
MITFLPSPITGGISVLIYFLNTVLWCTLLFGIAFLKLVAPVRVWRGLCDRMLNGIANAWIAVNNWSMQLTRRIQWDVIGLEGLDRNGWYLVLANHQSWTDILVLQKIFHRRAPFLKFFLKKELIWVPILGLAWWALDFPFMKRYSRARLEKHPHLAGKDIEITRKACQKFKTIPVSIMNFVEGTRFTSEKHRKQASPYAGLLRPRAGGIAFVLAAIGEQFHGILDVTIAYPQEGPKGFWAFLCGRLTQIKVRVRSLPIRKELLGDYDRDPEFRRRFQEWLNAVWAEKDRTMAALLG